MKQIILFFYLMIVISCHGQQKLAITPETLIINEDTNSCQEEVCAIETNNGELIVAWVDRKKGSQEKTVSFKISSNNKKNWSKIYKHDNKDFIWTGNPALAKDDVGNLYLIDMSTN